MKRLFALLLLPLSGALFAQGVGVSSGVSGLPSSPSFINITASGTITLTNGVSNSFLQTQSGIVNNHSTWTIDNAGSPSTMIYGVGVSPACASGARCGLIGTQTNDALEFRTNQNIWLTLKTDGSFSSAKTCDAGFTRLGPNYCSRTDSLSFAAAPSSCTSVTLPTGAKALVYAVSLNNDTNNAAGNFRSTAVNWWNEATCAVGNPVGGVSTGAREEVAAVDVLLSSLSTTVTIPINAGALWALRVHTGGAGSTSSIQIRGYFD